MELPAVLHVGKLVDELENEAVAFFHFQTLSILQTCQPMRIWSSTFGFLVQTEPCLRRITIALGYQHRKAMNRQTGTIALASPTDQARSDLFYGRAIRSMRQAVAVASPDHLTILACACVLLVILEVLRESPKEMLLHLESGVRMITEAVPIGSASQDPDMLEIVTLLQQHCISAWMFCTSYHYDSDLALILQKIEFGRLADYNMREVSYGSLDLHNHMAKVILTVRKLMHPASSLEIRTDSLYSLYRLRTCVQKWTEFRPEVRAQNDRSTENATAGEGFLTAKSIMLQLFLEMALSKATDRRKETARFTDVLDLLERSLSRICPTMISTGHHRVMPEFSIGLGAVQMLETIEKATVDDCLRQRAAALYERCPLREGLWRSWRKSVGPELATQVSSRLPRRFYATSSADRLATAEDVISAAQAMCFWKGLQTDIIANLSASGIDNVSF